MYELPLPAIKTKFYKSTPAIKSNGNFINMKKLFYLTTISVLGLAINLHAQNNFWKSKDAYLGQKRLRAI